MEHLDRLDRKLLESLQADGRLTNAELSDLVGLSASQCSRRRSQLETDGTIRGYHADLEPLKVGVGITCMISVNLASHSDDNAQKFHALLLRLPEVLEVHALTGEMDYSIKVVAKDLQALSAFISNTLLPHKAVQNVKSSIVLQTIKQTHALPLDAAG